jgi:Flp pilus assembly pilin Flp
MRMRRFLKDELGQDLVEFSLLLAFVMFSVAGFGGGFELTMQGVSNTLNASFADASAATHWTQVDHYGGTIR